MQPMHLQLHATNYHLQLILIVYTTMLQLHLQLMTFSFYSLKKNSSMIMLTCPINCKWNQT
jgi:hypothetical protein